MNPKMNRAEVFSSISVCIIMNWHWTSDFSDQSGPPSLAKELPIRRCSLIVEVQLMIDRQRHGSLMSGTS
jgi:hypothetical protein